MHIHIINIQVFFKTKIIMTEAMVRLKQFQYVKNVNRLHLKHVTQAR